MHIRGARGSFTATARSVVTYGAVGVVVAAGCSTTKPTELVPGVMTQLRVPRDLRAVQVEVDANGKTVFCQGYDVDQAGVVELPATLGVVSATSPNTSVKVVIRGYDAAGAAAGNYNSCPDPTPAGTAPAPRVLRTSIQTFVDQHTLFLPMALSYSCFDEDCSGSTACGSSDCVCKGAQCVAAKTDANKLVDFDPSLIDGKGLCFSPKACFPPGPATFAVEPIDPDRCLYEVPSGVGVNVRVLYEDVTWSVAPGTTSYEKTLGNASESEILNEDEEEGFCLGACAASDANAAGADGSTDAGTSSGDPGDAATSAMAATDAAGAGAGSIGVQRFQLAPGLCKLVKAARTPPPLALGTPARGYLTIGEVQVGVGCPASKSPLLPICAAERTYGPSGDAAGSGAGGASGANGGTTNDVCGAQVPLASTPSAVYLVMDDSSVMKSAFGVGGYATVMSLSLAAPVFSRTYAAFRYFAHTSADAGTFDRSACTSATTGFSTPTVAFGPATDVQAQIGDQVRNWQPPGDSEGDPAPLDLQAALRPGVGAYSAVTDFLRGKEATNVAAVMLFVNRLPSSANDCDPPVLGSPDIKTAIEQEIRAAYSATPSVRTYFVVLADSNGPDGGADPATLAFYQGLQTDLPQMVTTIDATLPTTQASQVLTNFTQAAEPLGTCLYEPVAGIGTLQYSVPASPGSPVRVAPNPACNAGNQTSVDGWSLDEGRVRVCGGPCTDLQNTILVASAVAQQNQMPVPQVTVSGTILCGGATSPLADGGSDGADPAGGSGRDVQLAAAGDATAAQDDAPAAPGPTQADGATGGGSSNSGGAVSASSSASGMGGGADDGGLPQDAATTANARDTGSISPSSGGGSGPSTTIDDSGASLSLGSSSSASSAPGLDSSLTPVRLDAASAL